VPARSSHWGTNVRRPTSLLTFLVFDEDLDASKRARLEYYVALCDEFLAEQA